MKKLLTTLSILILLLGVTILTSNKVFASDGIQPMKLTNITQDQNNQTILTFTDIKGEAWSCYGDEDSDKIGIIYSVTMDNERLINYTDASVNDINLYNELSQSYKEYLVNMAKYNTQIQQLNHDQYDREYGKANKEIIESTVKLCSITSNPTTGQMDYKNLNTQGTIINKDGYILVNKALNQLNNDNTNDIQIVLNNKSNTVKEAYNVDVVHSNNNITILKIKNMKAINNLYNLNVTKVTDNNILNILQNLNISNN